MNSTNNQKKNKKKKRKNKKKDNANRQKNNFTKKNINIPTINSFQQPQKSKVKDITYFVILIQKNFRRFLAMRKVEDLKMEREMNVYYQEQDNLKICFDVLIRFHFKKVLFNFVRERKAKLIRICKYIRRYRFVQTIRRNIFQKRLAKVAFEIIFLI